VVEGFSCLATATLQPLQLLDACPASRVTGGSEFRFAVPRFLVEGDWCRQLRQRSGERLV
jgi:hypothetical protein